jgi:pimeloyl-ACP methyl ester carboxylesterase
MRIDDRTLETHDGTRIVYSVAGDGPALVLTNGLTTTTTFWKYVLPIWQRSHTVITWDLPGHGRSEPARSAASASVEALARLQAQIMDAASIRRAVQIGWSTGCQLVLELYRQFPERCAGLGLLLGPAGHVLQTTSFPLPGPTSARLLRVAPRRAFAVFCGVVSRAMLLPGSIALGRKLQLIGEHTRAEDMQQVLSHIGTVHPGTLRDMLLSLHDHSASEVLSSLQVPLLIVAGDQDPFAPSQHVGLPLHAASPESELLRLPFGTHTALLDQPEVIARAVEGLASRSFSR